VTKLFFATDVHGSDICWSKFLNAGKFYEADLLILGGDMTGKGDTDAVNIIVCAELTELIPGNLEMPI
jgi:Icc-related predicted phosphoesterase